MTLPLDNPLFTIPTLTGSIFILAGIIMVKFSPKNINALYGYRTKSSMKNQERWNFAQKYSARELVKWGVFLTLSGFLGLFFQPNEIAGVFIGLGLMIVIVITLIVRVEYAIKKRFNKP